MQVTNKTDFDHSTASALQDFYQAKGKGYPAPESVLTL